MAYPEKIRMPTSNFVGHLFSIENKKKLESYRLNK